MRMGLGDMGDTVRAGTAAQIRSKRAVDFRGVGLPVQGQMDGFISIPRTYQPQREPDQHLIVREGKIKLLPDV